MDKKTLTKTLIISTSVITGLGIMFLFRKQLRQLTLLPMLLLMEKENQDKINKLHPNFRRTVLEFLLEVKNKLGYDAVITQTTRTQAQAQANANAGIGAKYSYHLEGIAQAFDVNFMKNGAFVLTKTSSPEKWKPVVEIANKYNLTWGGTFKDVAYDPIHFDNRKNIGGLLPSKLITMPKDKDGYVIIKNT